MNFKINKTFSVAGLSMSEIRTISGEGGLAPLEVSVPAGKAGTLTTRTDNDTGTATLGAGHGILTGDRVDVYWIGGHRYGMTVGTVAGTSVPLDLGAGDNLPTAATAIVVCKANNYPFAFTGNNLDAIALAATGSGAGPATDTKQVQFTFVDAADAFLKSIIVTAGQV